MNRKVVMAPVHFTDRVVDRVAALLGALGFSQFPAFINNYLQRLGGHVDEAMRNVETWQAVADKTTNGNLTQLVNSYHSSDVPAVIEAGNKAQSDILRLDSLQSALASITDASPWERPFVFFRHVDADIADQTFHAYVPNIPTNVEGLIYAGIGLLLGMALYGTFKLTVKKSGGMVVRTIRRKRPALEAKG